MANKIKLKRGLSSNISSIVLDDGEVALTTDTNKLYSKKGEIAPNNVYVGTSEPLDSNIECWIDPSENFDSAATYFDRIYPVGSLYMSISSIDPSELFGGSWVKIEGKFLLSSSNSYAVGATGGEATHTLTVDEMPKHRHSFSTANGFTWYAILESVDGSPHATWDTSNGNLTSGALNETGGGQPHNNMPPYLVVNMWYRVK